MRSQPNWGNSISIRYTLTFTGGTYDENAPSTTCDVGTASGGDLYKCGTGTVVDGDSCVCDLTSVSAVDLKNAYNQVGSCT